jgi:hypothetical protein
MIQYAQDILKRIEGVLGGFLSLVISVSVMISAPLIAFERRTDDIVYGVFIYSLVAVICLLELLLVGALFRALGKRPYAPAVALSLPRLPLLLRIPVSAFWLVHLLFACGFIWIANSAFATSSGLTRIGLNVLAAGLSYLAFAYLLNAAATLKPDEAFILRIWSNRVWYAMLISGFVLLLPFTGLINKVPPVDGTDSQRRGAASTTPSQR